MSLSSAGASSRYWLAPHVHACSAGNQVILLDLRRDKYLGIGAPASFALAPHIEGWAETLPVDRPDTSPDNETSSLLTQMVEMGMLTRDVGKGKTARPAEVDYPKATLIDGYTEVRSAIRSKDAFRFAAASLTARALLRWRSLEYLADRFESGRSCKSAFDSDSARRCVAKFLRLRPLAFTAQDACLFDSLALKLFLSKYGFFPRWVFGVATGPFTAHCWLQQGGTVFNDTPEHVRKYTPIMVL